MTIRQRTDRRARIVREITVDGLTPTVVPVVDGPWTNVQINAPNLVAPQRKDASPRSNAAYVIGWADGFKGFPEGLEPGFRIEAAGLGVLELLGAPKALQTARAVTGWEARGQLIEKLYPLTADLQDQGGNSVDDSVRCAIWDETERQQPTGRYEHFDAELPLDWTPTVNQQLEVDGRIFRIASTKLNLEGPRHILELRTESLG